MPSYQPIRISRSASIPVRLYRYHVRLWGEQTRSAPPLVLLHGWMDVAASWQFVVDALPAEFLRHRLVIAPDWRGFGHTQGPACDHYVFADYLGDLDALLDHFAPSQPVDLVAHSMGGNVAMMYAGVRPERIRRLVNVEGFGMPRTEPAQTPQRLRQWLDEIAALHRAAKGLRSYTDASSVAGRLQQTNPRLPDDKAHWLARQWAEPRTDEDGQTRWHILGDPAHRVVSAQLPRVEETLALYRAITASVLMVEAGSSELAKWHEGHYTLDEFHARLECVQRAECVTLPDCGHMIHHDQPDLLAGQIARFLGES